MRFCGERSAAATCAASLLTATSQVAGCQLVEPYGCILGTEPTCRPNCGVHYAPVLCIERRFDLRDGRIVANQTKRQNTVSLLCPVRCIEKRHQGFTCRTPNSTGLPVQVTMSDLGCLRSNGKLNCSLRAHSAGGGRRSQGSCTRGVLRVLQFQSRVRFRNAFVVHPSYNTMNTRLDRRRHRVASYPDFFRGIYGPCRSIRWNA